MRPVKITPENMPAIPYYDGTRYYCYEWDCYTERKDLKECGVIPNNGATYTPILQCSACGRLYFGNPAPIPADEEAIRAEILKAEAEQRALKRTEEERHEAEQNGDIILPQLLTV